MASLDSKITITQDLRTCTVNGKKGLFHGWGNTCVMFRDPDGHEQMFSATSGMIEQEDGSIEMCYPHDITFTDGLFNQYAFKEDNTNGRKD